MKQMISNKTLISIIIPVYNEEGNINSLYEQLKINLGSIKKISYEIIYVDDGSRDKSVQLIRDLKSTDKRVRLIKLTRNFGKEIATTAGLHNALGDAALIIDADGQHPPELIPNFVEKWMNGSRLVVGVRTENQNEGLIKKTGSILFYKLFNGASGLKLIPGSTDFRLIDRTLLGEFNKLTERNRITRGLIDWLGYEPDIIKFKANPRIEGVAGYKFSKLLKLALTSFLSLSFKPLYIIGYLGIIITPLSALTLIAIFIEDVVLKDPLGFSISGSGYLGVVLVFMVGLILISQGLISIYISYIYEEVRNRPLYLVDRSIE